MKIRNGFIILFVAVVAVVIPKINSQCRPSSLVAFHENQRLTRVLHHHIKMWQIAPSLPQTTKITRSRTVPQNSSFSLLETAYQVAKAACPDRFVSHDFTLDGTLKAFSVLRTEVFGDSVGTVDYLKDLVSPTVYQRIYPILLSCQRKLLNENLKFDTDPMQKGCGGGLIRQICFKDENVLTCKNLNLRNMSKTADNSCAERGTNIILDVVWNVVDLVHGACLKYFRDADDLNAFHLWEQAMEALFTQKIRNYWYSSDLSTEEYQQILHPLPVQQIYNLEMCIEGLYYFSNEFQYPRLKRPANSERIYRKRRRRGAK